MKILMIIKVDGSSRFKLPSGWAILAVRPYTSEPEDDCLSLLLAYNVLKEEYVTWVYNHDTNGCEHGNYFSRWKSAYGDFLNRRVERPTDKAVLGLVEACQALVEFWDNGSPVQPGALQVRDLRLSLDEVKANIKED